ncbi:unnamed protein product [Closterium sp. NIES-53]
MFAILSSYFPSLVFLPFLVHHPPGAPSPPFLLGCPPSVQPASSTSAPPPLLVRPRTPPPLVRPVFDALFAPLAAVVLQSEDHTELQNGAEALAMFVRKGGEELVAGSADPDATMTTLLDAAANLLMPFHPFPFPSPSLSLSLLLPPPTPITGLLRPQLEPSASLFVEPLLVQLIRRVPSRFHPFLPPPLPLLPSKASKPTVGAVSIALCGPTVGAADPPRALAHGTTPAGAGGSYCPPHGRQAHALALRLAAARLCTPGALGITGLEASARPALCDAPAWPPVGPPLPALRMGHVPHAFCSPSHCFLYHCLYTPSNCLYPSMPPPPLLLSQHVALLLHLLRVTQHVAAVLLPSTSPVTHCPIPKGHPRVQGEDIDEEDEEGGEEEGGHGKEREGLDAGLPPVFASAELFSHLLDQEVRWDGWVAGCL